MLDDLAPMSVPEAARRMGVDPFEVVRLMVIAGAVPEGALLVDPEIVPKLRGIGRIDDPWWTGVSLPKDASPRRARVRAAVRLLLDKGRVGEDRTRLDNVWRGLEPPDRTLLERALEGLAEEGMIRITPSPIGPLVSVDPAEVEVARKFASGKHEVPALRALLDEA